VWRGWGKTLKTSFGIACTPTEVWTWHLPNASVERYLWTNLFGNRVVLTYYRTVSILRVSLNNHLRKISVRLGTVATHLPRNQKVTFSNSARHLLAKVIYISSVFHFMMLSVSGLQVKRRIGWRLVDNIVTYRDLRVTYRRVLDWLIGFIAPYTFRTRDYRQYSAIANLRTFSSPLHTH
jgi:hypothetical protein